VQVEPGELAAWCDAHLGSPPRRRLFAAGHLSAVIGVALADGREVVVKVRPGSPRLAACVEVQRHVHRCGFPCPEPLAGPTALGGMSATAETLIAGGTQLTHDADRPVRFAHALVDLVAAAPPSHAIGTLDPPPPWAWPDADAAWPAPDDVNVDLNASPGPAWVDALAGDVREVLLGHAQSVRVVGHVDFESQNVRWTAGGALHAVHDWDSVAALPEPAIAGLASAVFTATGEPLTDARVEESQRFLDAYRTRRGLRWSQAGVAIACAAGLWVRVFNAKKAYACGDPSVGGRLQSEMHDRLQLMRGT
jgi:hypothetical protein